MSGVTVAPVVVNPDMASNSASSTRVKCPVTRYGMAPTAAMVTHRDGDGSKHVEHANLLWSDGALPHDCTDDRCDDSSNQQRDDIGTAIDDVNNAGNGNADSDNGERQADDVQQERRSSLLGKQSLATVTEEPTLAGSAARGCQAGEADANHAVRGCSPDGPPPQVNACAALAANRGGQKPRRCRPHEERCCRAQCDRLLRGG